MTTPKKANITLDGQSTGLTIVERFPWESVEFVFDALFSAYHPNGMDGEDHADMRFVSLWTLFLSTAGWTEEEFWAESQKREKEHTCPDCGEEIHDEDDAALELPKTAKPVDNKAN